jgi:peptidoglycan L-alanyl-D-glutamate endopeptidase CwlK
MPQFGNDSKNYLSSIHPKLQRILQVAIKSVNFSITEGHRTVERQKELLAEGKTKTLNSKHLTYPSEAVDVAPYPYPDLRKDNPNREKELLQVYYLIGFIKGLAQAMDIKIKVGSDWNDDNDIRNDEFQDAWHIQLEGNNGSN